MRSFLRHRNVTEQQFSAQPGGARTLILFVLFCFVFVLFFPFTVVLNKDENEPNNTSCPTDTLIRPRRKTLCHDHLEQILNTSNMEIINHLVLATNHFCVMYKIILTVFLPKMCMYVCVVIPFCSERLAREPASKGHTGGRSRKSA